MKYPYTEPKQNLKTNEPSICVRCFHREVCRGIENQPCIECNKYFNLEEYVIGILFC